MTYLEYLLLFIIGPSLIILALFLINISKGQNSVTIREFLLSTFLISLIALIYTTPWDNYLVANGIWYYDPQKILGIVFGYVPLEEYSFFILETVLVSLIVGLTIQFGLVRITMTTSHSIQKKKWTIILLILIWMICFISFISNINQMEYFNLLLLWGIPAIIIQLYFGWQVLIENKRPIAVLLVIIGSYLSLTDAYAIHDGIWTISQDFTLGIVFIVIPLEEIIFFFLTAILVVMGNIITIYYFRNLNYILKMNEEKYLSLSIKKRLSFIIK